MRFHTILSVALLLVAAVAGTTAEQERQHRAKRVRLLSEAAQNAYVPAAGALYSAPAPAAGQLYAGAPAAGALYTGAKPAAGALYAGSAAAPAPAAGALYTGAKPAAGALYAGAAPSAGQLYAGAPATGQLYAAPAPASGASVSSSCFYTGPAGSYCTQSPEPHYYCGPAVFSGSNYNCIAESSTVFGCTPSGQLCQLQKNSKEAPCLAKSNFC